MGKLNFTDLLKDAFESEGELENAFHAFHNYSFNNCILAMLQCRNRGLKIGPLATYKQWAEKNRHVIRGQKAIELVMPSTRKSKREGEEDKTFTIFITVPRWFVYSQTEGEDFEIDCPKFNFNTALEKLKIEQIEFEMINGNVQGYATQNKVAINPMAEAKDRTLLHEMAHIVLGHTKENEVLSDDERTPKNIREVQAEAVTLLVIESLGLEGSKYCRGYIQNWIQGDKLSEKECKEIFTATNKILKAGTDQLIEKSKAA